MAYTNWKNDSNKQVESAKIEEKRKRIAFVVVWISYFKERTILYHKSSSKKRERWKDRKIGKIFKTTKFCFSLLLLFLFCF
jgi:hypothetical protein